MNHETLLDIRNLKVVFDTEHGPVTAVNGLDLRIHRGETVGLVGESGCGKSVSSLSILRLIPSPPGRIANGEIHYRGTDLLRLTAAKMRRMRGNEISMIFQEPMTALNPVFTVGDQLTEAIRLHREPRRRLAGTLAIEALKLVGIPEPERRLRDYPHQLSGGMRQRVMIAMALACEPALLIADEPTTALDVTIQAQILELLRDLQRRLGLTVLLITHDLGVVAQIAHRVAVMYAGNIIEERPVNGIFRSPRHPYTQALLRALPQMIPNDGVRRRLEAIDGSVPDLRNLPRGCSFQPRCPHAMPVCSTDPPPFPVDDDGWARCFLLGQGER